MEKRVLYQIKTLDKLIFRTLMGDVGFDEKRIEEIKKNKVITPTQMYIISYILKSPEGEVEQKDLEKVLNLRRATVSGVLHTMEKNDLIVRITNELDTRKKKIRLNSKAEEIFCENRKNFEKLEKIVRRDIEEEDLEVFFRVVEKMKQNIKSNENILKKGRISNIC